MKGDIHYLMFDGRARSGNTDDANVMSVEHSLEGVADSNKCFRGEDYVWYEYKEDENGNLQEVCMRMDLNNMGLRRM